jgi:hypothetical protein
MPPRSIIFSNYQLPSSTCIAELKKKNLLLTNTRNSLNYLLVSPSLTFPSSKVITMGTKRASPGAEDEKSPLQSAELSDEDAKKLEEIQRDLARAELVLGEAFWNYEGGNGS